jgi:sulfur carrier protein
VSVRVVLRNPRREVEVAGNRRVKDVLRDLDILPETVLVIRGDDLVTADQMLRDDDVIELRPVMSGGSEPHASRTGHLRSEPASRPSLP